MNLSIIKTVFCLLLTIACLLMAFATNDAVNGQLFASLGILTGVYSFKISSNQNTTIHEK